MNTLAQAILIESKLRLTFETGMKENGEPLFKSKTFANINNNATSEQLYQFSNAIDTLSANPLVSVQRDDRYRIIN